MTPIAHYSFYAQGRPRPYRSKQAHGHWYKPEKLEKWQELVYYQLLEQCDVPPQPHEGPVSVELQFAWPVPSSWPDWKREHYAGLPRCRTPDWDNCAKAVLDALEGTLIADDRQVYECNVQQHWAVFGERGVAVALECFEPQPETMEERDGS